MQNIVNNTQVGGYFIGTSYDGKVIFDMLRDYDKQDSKALFDSTNASSQGNKIWEVIKLYDKAYFDDDVTSLGYAIDVYQDSINKTFKEYLVNYDYFTKIMEQYGFRLLNQEELKSVGMTSSIGSFRDLYNTMKIESSKSKSKLYTGNALKMTQQEKEISFLNKYFVFKKIRHEISNVKLSDAPRIYEDEVAIDKIISDIEEKNI